VFLPARTSRQARISLFRKTPEALAAILFRMSRAFIKEDVDPPERSGRKRSASGLPPGATNYITAWREMFARRTACAEPGARSQGSELTIDDCGKQALILSGFVIPQPRSAKISVGICFPFTATSPSRRVRYFSFAFASVAPLTMTRASYSGVFVNSSRREARFTPSPMTV
jgi:hypothetical protein